MKTVYYILLLTLMSIVISCENKKFSNEIKQLQSTPINLSCCKDAVFIRNGVETNYSDADSVYKLIIYIDSTSCSPCFISSMLEYTETIETFDSAGVSTLFIFEPARQHEQDVIASIKRNAYPFQTVVVSNRRFSALNPHIPSTTVLHSFLLNENNNVTIVGNPVLNPKIRELMHNIITIKSN